MGVLSRQVGLEAAVDLLFTTQYLDVLSCLTMRAGCRSWRDAMECMTCSAAAVAAASALLTEYEYICEAKKRNAPHSRRRGGPCKILQMTSRPALSNFVYGEVALESMARLLTVAELKSGETFADLGCGAGKQLFLAAALVPNLSGLVGYELLDGYLNAARDLLSCITNPKLRISMNHTDFTDDAQDWLSADLVFAASTCFDENQMLRIAALAQYMRPGSRFITLDKPLPEPASSLFSLRYVCLCQGTWGPTLAYVQQRTQFSRHDEGSLFL